MVTTRSKTGAAPKLPDPDIALQHSFSNQSLLAWANGSRKNSKPGTVRKPQTASILNLPLDLLAIIFGYMHPLSLVQLGRTCIDLKIFLHSQASKPIWTQSRKAQSFTITADELKILGTWTRGAQEGAYSLPDCASYLTECGYAAFLFESLCTFCHEGGAGITKGSLTSRACYACRRKDFVSIKQLASEWKTDADSRLYDMLPRIDDGYNGKKPSKAAKVYHKSICQSIFDKALAYEMEVKFNARMMNAFYNKGEQEMKERVAFITAYSKFEQAKESLVHIESMKKDREIQERYERNKASVITRFEAEGRETFGTDLEDCFHAKHILRREKGELSDADFARIKADLVKHLEPVQAERRYITTYYDPENVRIRTRLDDFHLTLPLVPGLAGRIRLADFVELPTCKALASNAAFVNGEEEESKSIWAAHLNTVLEDIAAWVTTQENTILAILQEKKTAKLAIMHQTQRHVYDVELSKEHLRMPFAVFICNRCSALYPGGLEDVLVHNCYSRFLQHNLTNTRRRLRDEGVVMNGIFSSPLHFTSDNLLLNWEKTSIGKNIYEAVVAVGGEAPSTMTALKHKKGKLSCAECPEGTREREGMSVAMSYISHAGSSYYGNSKTHRNFTYVLPEGGVEADVNNDAPTPPIHMQYGGDFSDEYDSDMDPEDYLDMLEEAANTIGADLSD